MRPAAGMFTVLATASLVVSGGCAREGYDPRHLRAGLVGVGLSVEQVRCVTDRMEDRFDVGRLASRASPTPAERAVERAILRECRVSVRPHRAPTS